MYLSYDSITDQLFVGEYLHPVDVPEVVAIGVTAVVSLQTDEDLAAHQLDWPRLVETYQRAGISEAHRLPIRDLDPQDLRQRTREAAELVRRLIADGKVVYLHCSAGINRATTVAIASLYLGGEMSKVEAIRLVKDRRREAGPYVDCLP